MTIEQIEATDQLVREMERQRKAILSLAQLVKELPAPHNPTTTLMDALRQLDRTIEELRYRLP